MANKNPAALDSQPSELTPEKVLPQKNHAKAGGPPNASGFYIYIGPSIRGLLQSGTIFRGSKAQARRMAQKAIEKQPLVKTLIVSGDCLPEARLKVKTPGNALYANYRKIAGK